MTDEEIMIRAREAAIASMEFGSAANDCIRRGEWDDTRFVQAAAQALRDLAKPLSEIAPDAPIDPDLLAAREVAVSIHPVGARFAADYREGKNDATPTVRVILAAIKRGRAAVRAKAAVESPEPDATAEAGPVEHYRLERDQDSQWGIRALTPEMRAAAEKRLLIRPRDETFFSFGHWKGTAARLAKEIAATIEPTKAGGA